MAETTKKSEKLEHSVGGITTRDDVLDLGVKMLPGDPKETIGPEDALGAGPKRGDYTGRVGDSYYQPHQSVAVEGPKPGEPVARIEAQRPRTENISDEKGKKGGVETS